ncbi:thioredoxin, partial [Patescibacteria group bacterium]
MSKKTMIILALLLSLIVAVLFVVFRHDNAAAPSDTQTSAPAAASTTDTATSQETSAQQGEYVPYSEAAVAQTSNTKVLFFHAPWCPQCRQLDADITEKGVPAGVTIFKVDYDTNQALRQKYGVTIQTTLVTVDDQGQLIKKYVAY